MQTRRIPRNFLVYGKLGGWSIMTLFQYKMSLKEDFDSNTR